MIGITTQAGMMGRKTVEASSFAQAASIVALWDFESGARTTDSAGSNTLTQVGTPTTVTGKIGDGAGGFSASDYFEVANHVGPSGTAARTYFCWLKIPTTLAGFQIPFITPAILGNGNGEGAIIAVGGSGKIWFNSVRSYRSTNVSYNNNQWHSVVVSIPSNANISDVDLYIDGALAATAQTGTDNINTVSSGPVNIGANSINAAGGYNVFTGTIDQMGIADTAWSAADAADFHNSGDGRPTSYLLP